MIQVAFPARYETNIVQRAMGLQLALKKSWRTPGVCNLHRSFNRLLICQIFYCPCARCRDTKRTRWRPFLRVWCWCQRKGETWGGSVDFPVTHLKLHWSVRVFLPCHHTCKTSDARCGAFPHQTGCPTISLCSDTVYLESIRSHRRKVSDPIRPFPLQKPVPSPAGPLCF